MYKVLIVDDEPIVKIALRSIINWNEYGYSICATASDGKEALSLVSKHSPELIITDLKMPVMDGISLIKTLKEQHFPGEILVISNYEDFDSVRSALVMGAADYILKVSIEAKTLIEQLNTISKRLNRSHSDTALSQNYKKEQLENQKLKYQHQLKSYLEDSGYSLTMLQECFPYDPNCLNDDYAICYLDFNLQETDLKDRFSGSLVSHCLEEAFENISHKEIIFLGYNTVLTLLPMTSLRAQNISMIALISKLPAIFQLYMSMSPTIIYQEEVQGYNDLKKWYHTFLNITTLDFYEPLTLIQAKSYIPVHYMNFIYYKDFVNVIQVNNITHLDDSIRKIDEVVTCCRELHIYPEILKSFFKKSLDLIEYINHPHSIEIHDYLTDLKEAIRTCRSSSELSNLVVLSLETLFSPIASVTKKDLRNIKYETMTAIDYINHNYNKHITLTLIAEKVNLSSSYLCRLFKSEMGMSITNYINQLRMEKAGELLRNSSINVYMKEISAAVGIDDQLYFSRIFKKYYGVTPSEYRLKYHHKSN